jgi:hypothetical protein
MVVLAACDGASTEAPASTPASPSFTSQTEPASPASPATERVGFIGLPPEDANPSTPPSGELLLSHNGYEPPHNGVRDDLYVYADGTMIWQKWSFTNTPVGVPERADQFGSGYLEQRLTAAGVRLLRSRFLSTGLFERDLQLRSRSFHPGLTMAVRRGDRMVVFSASHIPSWRSDVIKETPAQARAIVRLNALLSDPAAWLPTKAWADREIQAYVASRYTATFDRRQPSPLEFPPPADELLFDDCNVLTVEEVRSISNALEDAGITPSPNVEELAYEIYENGDTTHPAYLHFHPVLPDQESIPGWRGWRGDC